MEMTGERLIAVPQQKVWEALIDSDVLKACIPGCERVEKLSDTEYSMAMTVAVGPVKAKFNGKLLLSDLNPPDAYTLNFEGSGGAAGFCKGASHVTLVPENGSTRLCYQAKASVGGKIAQVGSRLVDAAARKVAEDFFARFDATIAPVPPEAPTAPVSKPLPRWIWVLLAIVAALILAWVLSGSN